MITYKIYKAEPRGFTSYPIAFGTPSKTSFFGILNAPYYLVERFDGGVYTGYKSFLLSNVNESSMKEVYKNNIWTKNRYSVTEATNPNFNYTYIETTKKSMEALSICMMEGLLED